MGTSFNEQFDQHGAWRREFALRLKLLSEWMKDHELLDSAVEERLRRLEQQMRSDKVMVAFVAEFSRGKSELINAIFFAGYGRRIMWASIIALVIRLAALVTQAAAADEPQLNPVQYALPLAVIVVSALMLGGKTARKKRREMGPSVLARAEA